MEETNRGRGLVIACQGIRGAYSQIAAERLFPEGSFLYFRNFDAVARAVREDLCDFGLLPIENNTYGSVKQVYQILGRQDISIVRGYRLRIRHQLLAKPGTRLKDLTAVCSHEQAGSEEPGIAAISSPECADLYGLEVLKRRIADSDHNYTRFLCIAKEPRVSGDADRISLILSLPHRPGALAGVLDRFAREHINLWKIESAPIPGRDFEFRFYIDIEGSVRDPKVQGILDSLKADCPEFRFLGNYREEIDGGEAAD